MLLLNKTLKAFLNENLQSMFCFSFSRLHLSSSWQRLSLPRLQPWTWQEKQQLCFTFWALRLKLLHMCQVVVQEFPRREPADQQAGDTQRNLAECVHTRRQVSNYVMKEQSCFQSPLSQNFNFHSAHCVVQEYIPLCFSMNSIERASRFIDLLCLEALSDDV